MSRKLIKNSAGKLQKNACGGLRREIVSRAPKRVVVTISGVSGYPCEVSYIPEVQIQSGIVLDSDVSGIIGTYLNRIQCSWHLPAITGLIKSWIYGSGELSCDNEWQLRTHYIPASDFIASFHIDFDRCWVNDIYVATEQYMLSDDGYGAVLNMFNGHLAPQPTCSLCEITQGEFPENEVYKLGGNCTFEIEW